MMKKIVYIVVAVILAALVIFIYGYRQATKLPDNSPAAFFSKKSSSDKKIVVCIGDSITHASVSYNYVDILTEKFSEKGFEFVNAGINSELAYNVLQRIEEIVKCKPDYVTILIGTNDANATLNEENSKRYMEKMKLPQKPTSRWYRVNLIKIITKLKKIKNIKIAVISLPPIGEETSHKAFLRSKEYSSIIKDVARKENIYYLPLNEIMIKHLAKHGKKPRVNYADNQKVMYMGILSHHLLGKSYNDISEGNGFILVTDFLHLNKKGASMVVDLIEGFLMRN